MGDHAAKYNFQYLAGKKCKTLEDKDTQEYLMKWSMKDRICVQTFSFDQPFQAYQKKDFVLDFMKDPTVLANLRLLTSSGKWQSVGTAATSVKIEDMNCSVLSLSFFDRLYQTNVVRESGQIHKCFDEFAEDFQISDELRKMLLIDDSDNYCLFNDDERNELLFLIFSHLCLGGQVCQFEDTVDPYLSISKALYKDLVSVQKDPETHQLHTISNVFKITASIQNSICTTY
ncbi:cilia- and flagella-associated protein 300-like isoform X2 [Liolophura sinensis]|uniref:cilia- and flagella-associated protein 300-like isoform X2 n=1 Tax=Liolophura sinensis TaxID=3198878 RepID=UPI00315971C0